MSCVYIYEFVDFSIFRFFDWRRTRCLLLTTQCLQLSVCVYRHRRLLLYTVALTAAAFAVAIAVSVAVTIAVAVAVAVG